MPLRPGDTLNNGQFQILAQLGQGGFGFVYRARDTYLNEDVAVKELLPHLIADPTWLQRFLAEAKATIHLRHPSIVGTRQVFPDRGNYYIIMDFMPGGSLEDHLQRGPLPIPDCIRIAAEVCDALEYAHGLGRVHCDLKPANILFADDGSARLADFGIAHIPSQLATRSWQSSTNFVAGTLPYMAPEQLAGVRDNPRLDLYALGAILYEMLTGRPYLDFDRRNTPLAQSDNIQRIRQLQPYPPNAHRPDIPPWLDKAVLTALAKDSAQRHPSAAAFQSTLLNPPRNSRQDHPRRAPTATLSRARVGCIAFMSYHDNLYDIYVMGADGSNPLKLGEGQAPDWSPDGRRIVFASARDGRLSVYVMDADGSGVTRLTNTFPGDYAPAWSPDGRRIAFTSGRDGFTLTQIYVMNTDGSNQTRLTRTEFDGEFPAWSPDGRRIAFTANRHGYFAIYVMNADGTNLLKLTDGHDPAWSPDGRRIAFTSNRDGYFAIYVMNADGSNPTRLTHTTASDGSCAWSPDGRRIAFTSNRDGYFAIYVTNDDGSGLTRLTDSTLNGMGPVWSP